MMVIFSGRAPECTEALLEAAAIDGAGPIRRFRHITHPLMTPLIFL